ncbi:two component response regulator receiver protein [Leptospira ryugenii]|uniref:Two component response regulator receiver protein n=1 Tax=Leptospira ryugenii TaxID=1917863 RepID=A0A2P2DVW5_9LEPT|nr:response regulator [Leptospira ryugenii]GBF48747.1 two component response regulator receiver protein [Leptospira ryugenii]
MQKSLLIVEDIHSIREAIIDLLSNKYRVFGAENFDEAMTILQNEKIDLTITDIRLPGKSGIDIVKHIQTNYPNTIYSLMTAYNINDYIHYAKELNIWNIIPKYSFLDIHLIEVMVDKLLSNDIFGVEKYFGSEFIIKKDNVNTEFEDAPKNGVIYKQITSDQDRSILCGKISKYLIQLGAPKAIQQVLEELTSNAMIRAPRTSEGEYKYQFEIPSHDMVVAVDNIELSKDDYFTIGYGSTDTTLFIVVRDQFGSLRKEEILHRLDRHISVDESTGFPKGLGDSHGRGLYICREISDQLIFNIEPGKCTETIAMVNREGRSGFKALSIYEINTKESI